VVVGPGDVPVPGWGDPLHATVGQRPDLPATTGVLEVVADAVVGEVVRAGGAALGERADVVELAVGRFALAAGEAA
jgi:hypothetical protein